MKTIQDCLLDSEEHAVEAAVPAVAEDAAEIIDELVDVLRDCERNIIISTRSDYARLDRIRKAIALTEPK